MLSDAKWSAPKTSIKSHITQTEQIIFRNICTEINKKEAVNLKVSKRGRYMESFGRRTGTGNEAITILKVKKKGKGIHKINFLARKKKRELERLQGSDSPPHFPSMF